MVVFAAITALIIAIKTKSTLIFLGALLSILKSLVLVFTESFLCTNESESAVKTNVVSMFHDRDSVLVTTVDS